jgi:hypothetical protein
MSGRSRPGGRSEYPVALASCGVEEDLCSRFALIMILGEIASGARSFMPRRVTQREHLDERPERSATRGPDSQGVAGLWGGPDRALIGLCQLAVGRSTTFVPGGEAENYFSR